MTINQFMNCEGTMHAMETLEMLPEVPTRKKKNVAFVVDNSRNVKLRETGWRAVFWDDCGICSRDNNSAKHFYRFKDQSTYENVMISKGKYCKNATEDKRRVRKPLDPQPSPCSILTLARRYTQLKKAATYHRRVRGVNSTKVWSHKAFLTERALYEYVGEFPGFSTYGSFPEERGQYQRTHPLVHMLMKEQIADDYNPQITYRKLTKEEYAVGARNIAQVYRKKQLMNGSEAGELGSKTLRTK